MDKLYLLRKCLEIVPYIYSKGMKTSISDLQKKFKLSRKALGEIISMVLYSGFPPYTPETYFDMFIDDKNPDIINIWIPQKGLLDKPVNLTLNEAYALLVVYRFISKSIKIGSINSVLKKLEESLLVKTDVALKTSKEVIDFSINRHSFLHVYNLIAKSIQKKLSIDIEYYSAGKDELTTRRVDPYIIINHLSIWYLVGYCHIRKEFRMFRLERIKSFRQTNTSFVPDPSFDKSDYTSDDPFDLTERAANEFMAHLRFNSSVSKIAKDEFYFADFQELPSGDLLVKVPLFSEKWLLSKIRQFGSNVKIIAPFELKESLIRSYENILNKYSV